MCGTYGMDERAAATLALIMHRLGYLIHFADDERLWGDVILQPQWLTKAISFILEDPVNRGNGPHFAGQPPKGNLARPRFQKRAEIRPGLVSFFLRLMEKYDFSYRLEGGEASLIAQHVSQVRPALPWGPEAAIPPDRRRLALVCEMERRPRLGWCPG